MGMGLLTGERYIEIILSRGRKFKSRRTITMASVCGDKKKFCREEAGDQSRLSDNNIGSKVKLRLSAFIIRGKEFTTQETREQERQVKSDESMKGLSHQTPRPTILLLKSYGEALRKVTRLDV